MVSFGVWENTVFKGTVIFSRGASSNIHKPFGLKITEIAELTRVALTTHETHVSKIISVCLKLLRIKEPSIKLIVSYADPNHNHLGKIYQASNWIYLGKTNKTEKFIDRTGRIWHSRQVKANGITRQFGQTRAGPKRSECGRLIELPKHKYAYPLNQQMRDQLLKRAKPFPK